MKSQNKLEKHERANNYGFLMIIFEPYFQKSLFNHVLLDFFS
jgi:hypothetical protein